MRNIAPMAIDWAVCSWERAVGPSVACDRRQPVNIRPVYHAATADCLCPYDLRDAIRRGLVRRQLVHQEVLWAALLQQVDLHAVV